MKKAICLIVLTIFLCGCSGGNDVISDIYIAEESPAVTISSKATTPTVPETTTSEMTTTTVTTVTTTTASETTVTTAATKE